MKPKKPNPDVRPATDEQMLVEMWPIGRPRPYPKNARKLSDRAVALCAQSIREFGWRQPIVCDRGDVIVVGHTRLLAAQSLQLAEVPVHVAASLTPEQCQAYRLMDNRTADETEWDMGALEAEMTAMQAAGIDLSLTGFDAAQLKEILGKEVQEDDAPPLPVDPVSRTGDLWICGAHRVLCGDATSLEAVTALLGDRKPFLMVTDPPYGIELDSEWRDRAGLNGHGPSEPSYLKRRTRGHTETTISGDTRADWSEAFALVPCLKVAYVWHASKFTREVLDGLLAIGFLHHQQIIWDKGRTVLTRTHYWFQHEPCWYVRKGEAYMLGHEPVWYARKKNAPWFGTPGDNSTVWVAASPKFIMGSSDEEKFDHPTQKPVDLMRKPILNHTRPGDLVYDPFLGSGTTLAAAELTARACCGLEMDPKYVDVIVERWQTLAGSEATLEGDGRTFAAIKAERLAAAANAAS